VLFPHTYLARDFVGWRQLDARWSPTTIVDRAARPAFSALIFQARRPTSCRKVTRHADRHSGGAFSADTGGRLRHLSAFAVTVDAVPSAEPEARSARRSRSTCRLPASSPWGAHPRADAAAGELARCWRRAGASRPILTQLAALGDRSAAPQTVAPRLYVAPASPARSHAVGMKAAKTLAITGRRGRFSNWRLRHRGRSVRHRPGAGKGAPAVVVSALILALLIGLFGGLFVVQVVTRLRLVRRAPGALATDHVPARVARFVREVVFQSKVIAARPVVGLAHALVFWGFVAFTGYTVGQFLAGLRIVDITHTAAFEWYARALVPFAVAVLVGIVGLVIRRVAVRPEALGPLSWESVLIGGFIATLMITFLREAFHLDEGLAASVNWWLHTVVLLVFLALIPNSKHFHLVLSPVTIFLASPTLANVRNLDFEREEVGLETVAHLEKKQVLDAFTCVECGGR
jgi:hypothetical protein